MIFFFYKMNKINKSDIYCIKCLTVIDNSTNIQLNKDKVQINRLHSNCID